MRTRDKILDGLFCLWPGLRGLWRHGRLSGLVTAILFATILQLVLLTCLIWPDLISASSRLVVCFSGVLFWLVFTIPEFTRSKIFRTASIESVDREHLFQSAQNEYLKGNWFQAETLFGRLVHLDAEDVDARLYLATMNRRIDRIDEANCELDELDNASAARRWQWELKKERHLLARRNQELLESAEGRTSAVDAA